MTWPPRGRHAVIADWPVGRLASEVSPYPMADSPLLTRRHFLQQSSALVAGAAVAEPLTAGTPSPTPATAFRSAWTGDPDRPWLGRHYWANPLQDWRVQAGRAECHHAALDRHVHLLTHALGTSGDFTLRVRLGRVGGGPLGPGSGSAGFRLGIRTSLPDPRHRLVAGRGLDAGLTAAGGLFIGSAAQARNGTFDPSLPAAELRLAGRSRPDGTSLRLSVSNEQGQEVASLEQVVPSARVAGGLALVANFAGPAAAGAAKAKAKQAAAAGLGAFWFDGWEVSGGAMQVDPGQAFGPLLFSQYTVHGGGLKLSVQLPPLGAADTPVVRLQFKEGKGWRAVAEAPIEPEARLAVFRLTGWDASRDRDYRLVYDLKARDGRTEEHEWTGRIRRDPVDQPVITVGDVSCNTHEAFPNAEATSAMAALNPDLLAFVGDQFYESSGGYGIVRNPVPVAVLDYLRKWYLHGWTWRELTRDRPSLSLPDDHDVYQGNIWGESGRPQGPTQESGGYTMARPWVNVVYRTQTAHHPDAHEAGTSEDVIQYYGALTYGGISFAVLADRQYKSGPEGKVPPTGGRGDHVRDPAFDPRTADVAGLALLGERQEAFLEAWTRDWRGAEMKAVISQTLFTALPTTHGRERDVLRADYDTNAWPQTPRNRAVRALRRAGAFHLAGDQHLPAVVQYGIDGHADGPLAFAGPAVNVGYPRWWEPQRAPWTKPRQPGLTGDFTDSFGHPVTVLAVRNGPDSPEAGDLLRYLEERTSGIGVVRFDKPHRRLRIECWPLRADVTRPGTQMPGWPVEVEAFANHGGRIVGHLPTLEVRGCARPVIEVTPESDERSAYVLRAPAAEFRPPVLVVGRHRVRVSDPETGRSAGLAGLEPGEGRLVVTL